MSGKRKTDNLEEILSSNMFPPGCIVSLHFGGNPIRRCILLANSYAPVEAEVERYARIAPLVRDSGSIICSMGLRVKVIFTGEPFFFEWNTSFESIDKFSRLFSA
jgi:hypothetical protein